MVTFTSYSVYTLTAEAYTEPFLKDERTPDDRLQPILGPHPSGQYLYGASPVRWKRS